MKTKMAMKLIVLGVIIVAVSHWLRGHDILTGLALSLLFLAVVFKVAFALIIRRRSGLPPSTEGGDLADRREPRPPGGRPPALSAEEEVRHESAA
jgi:hypothetical protein